MRGMYEEARFLLSHLEQQIEEKCGLVLSKSTRRHFESFEEHQSIHVNFGNPEQAIRKQND
jgi:hypothetical protein